MLVQGKLYIYAKGHKTGDLIWLKVAAAKALAAGTDRVSTADGREIVLWGIAKGRKTQAYLNQRNLITIIPVVLTDQRIGGVSAQIGVNPKKGTDWLLVWGSKLYDFAAHDVGANVPIRIQAAVLRPTTVAKTREVRSQMWKEISE